MLFPIPNSQFPTSLTFILFFIFCFPLALFSQDYLQCDTETSLELYQQHRDEVSDIEAFANAESTNTSLPIPIKFTIVNKDDGSGNDNINQTTIDDAINRLNEDFSDVGITFVECGNATLINNTILYENQFFNFLYSYTNSAVNVYVHGDGVGGGFATLPCGFNGTGVGCSGDFKLDNFMYLGGDLSLSSNVFTHEMGHSLGLFHTFSPSVKYRFPVEPLQTDHPYNGIGARRELVIRTDYPDESGKLFKQVNCLTSGDLVCDTPAECARVSLHFPDPTDLEDCLDDLPATVCNHGCKYSFSTCEYTGNYQDYNEDPISLNPTPYALGRNHMSYASSSCRNEFVPGQVDRMLFYNEYRQSQYDLSFCDNFNDKVEFEDTETGIDRVSIEINHSGDEFSRMHTDVNRFFGGSLYENTLTANVKRLGSSYNFDTDEFTYTQADWLSGINTWDLILISQHIFGIINLNGYRQIAADVNKSGTITAFDMVTIRKLILLETEEIEIEGGVEHPWIFMPEYIPQDFTAAFHQDPFNMILNGVQYEDKAPYTEPNWEFVIPDGTSGKAGFDAVKAGDVSGSSEMERVENPLCVDKARYLADETYPVLVNEEMEVDVKIYNFQNIAGYQMGLNMSSNDFELLEVREVTSFGLPESEEFAWQRSGDGLRILWYDSNGGTKNLQNGESLFKIRLRAKNNINDISTVLRGDDSVLKTQFYLSNGCEADVDIKLTLNTASIRDDVNTDYSTNKINKLRCIPNPFNREVKLVLDVDESTNGIIYLQDILGEVKFKIKEEFQEGRNIIKLKDIESLSSGIFFVTVETEKAKYTSKIVKH